MGRDINPNDLDVYMKAIQTDIEEIKNTQLIGSDNLLIYSSYFIVPTPYDYTFTVLSGATKRLDLTFYARTQDFFFYNFNADLWRGATFATATKIPLYSDSLQANIDFGIQKQVTVPFIIQNPTVSTQTFYIKFYMLTTDRGTGVANIREYA